MRAAAAAIVFIFGAAVILVMANSLNSWVVGGLIGGLAALLISIPISLMLFTVLSRRHDLKLQAIHQELSEMGYVDVDEHGYEEVYETEAYVLSDDEYYNQAAHHKNANVHALPAAGQSHASFQAYKRPSQALPQERVKGTPTRDLSSERPPAKRTRHEVNAMRSRFQTAALHAARLEAQQLEDFERTSTHTRGANTNVTPGRSPRPSSAQSETSRYVRPGSDPNRQQKAVQQNSSQRPLSTTSGQQNRTRRSTASEDRYSKNWSPQTDSLYMNGIQSGSLRMKSSVPETEKLRSQPQTGQMTRNPQLEQSTRNPDLITGSLNSPLVRRAPYLYDDDPLRQELAQQIDEEPIVRRSSRHLYIEDTD
jgi:hypothetical protein